ncbi:RNA polymerase sigma factor [Arcicella lustrica]|uniref:RNA polymerase sigma factor n=1 Tax=Arcicella lustrica TaxID=2984196 RepID=A0ABU5SCX7_9BACT|nr:RNA polymerase sigma factor [Arcicella sp. DC25W]MEA5425138.1 RNA polymerase sigma factor [Arcicella sp. DC25W]
MKTQSEIIKRCLKGDENAFSTIYHQYASKMMVVCIRYSHDREEAKDLLQEGFIRVFQHLNQFKGEGSFEGWIKRIIVNVALEFYRKNTNQRQLYEISSDYEEQHPISSEDILSNIHARDLLNLVQKLPPTYRMIFNLYEFEGFKHQEIANQLGISEGTSKSNLFDARKILQRLVSEMMKEIKY